MADEKTEKPTPRKLRRAREQGQVPRSREMQSALVFLAVVVVLGMVYNKTLYTLTRLLILWRDISPESLLKPEQTIYSAWKPVISLWVWTVVLLGAVVLVVVVLTNMVFGGFVLAWKRLIPRLDALNPISNLKNMFSLNKLMETLFGIVKLFVISAVVYLYLKDHWAALISVMGVNFKAQMYEFIEVVNSLLWRVGLIYLLIAVVDWYYQKWHYMKNMRMTKQEVKEEMKAMEGNPQVKSKIRQKMYAMVMRRMLIDTKNATAVITNPTEFAVAIQYEENMVAPKVVAKGTGWMAKRIKDIARKHGIPIFRRPRLARRLFWEHEVGDYIKPDFYLEVAKIIRDVIMRKRRGRR
ncbi:MAG: EscU/YscU/HrcU family type III secretion system export apparatus switch protein [Dictyoglomi bacterium]|nr:EscU/YscU/HrcU family type III secretion system export apparatus switch protein [Dictyoglomota bacterium]